MTQVFLLVIFQENPQDDTTWYNSSDLYNLHFDNTEKNERFASRYVWSNNFTQITSSTSPILYGVQLRSANNLMRRYLLNHVDLEALMNAALSVERLNVFSVFDLIGHDDFLNDMNQAMNYTRHPDQFGLLASEVLNSSFFTPLKHKSSLMVDVDKLNAVVSFPVSISELAPMKFSCRVCKDKVATHMTVDQYFCGNICYEFYYLFKSKTIYR